MKSERIYELVEKGRGLIQDGVTITEPRFLAWTEGVKSLLYNEFGEESIEYRSFDEKMRGIDEELKQREENHNISHPPITRNLIESTLLLMTDYLRED